MTRLKARLKAARTGSTEAVGELADRGALLLQRGCDVHAPAGDVAHHRLADELGEAGPANAERDIASSWASRPRSSSERGRDEYVDGAAIEGQALPASPSARPDRSPSRPGSPESRGCPRARDHGLAAGPELAASEAISRRMLCIQSSLGDGRLDVDRPRQDLDEVAGGRVRERTAHR